MGFNNQERINLSSKVIAASVKDANETGQWYESFFANQFILTGNKVWTDPDFSLLKNLAAKNLDDARLNAESYPEIIQDLSQPVSAVRLTEIPGTNKSTYAAFAEYNNLGSGQLDNWLQPQLVPRNDGAFKGFPSIGYSVRLFDGDPSSGGTEIFTSAGQTGAGELASVGWIFDYANGILLLSKDFRNTLNDPYILGFRYIGSTAQAGGGGTCEYVQEQINVDSDGQVIFNLDKTPQDPDSVQVFLNGIKLIYGLDYLVNGNIIHYAASTALVTTDRLEAWYIFRCTGGGGGGGSVGTLLEVLTNGNNAGGLDINNAGEIRANDGVNTSLLSFTDTTVKPGSIEPGESRVWAHTDGYLVYTDSSDNDFKIAIERINGGLVNVYVSNVDGDDTNDGSQNSPVKTLDRAFDLLDRTTNARHNIYLIYTGEPYDGSAITKKINLCGPVSIIGLGDEEIFPEMEIEPGSEKFRIRFKDSPITSENEIIFQHGYLTPVSSSTITSKYLIYYNSADGDVYFANMGSAVPGDTDTYRITRPSVELILPQNFNSGFITDLTNRTILQNLKITFSTTASQIDISNHICFYYCYTDYSSYINVSGNQVYLGQISAPNSNLQALSSSIFLYGAALRGCRIHTVSDSRLGSIGSYATSPGTDNVTAFAISGGGRTFFDYDNPIFITARPGSNWVMYVRAGAWLRANVSAIHEVGSSSGIRVYEGGTLDLYGARIYTDGPIYADGYGKIKITSANTIVPGGGYRVGDIDIVGDVHRGEYIVADDGSSIFRG